MGKRRWTVRVSCVLLAMLLTSGLPGSARADSLRDATQEKEKLESSLKEAQQLIESLQGSREDIQDKVTKLDARLTEISTSIENLQQQLETKNTQITDTKSVLKQAKSDEKRQYESMKLRIRFMYENSRTGYVTRLLSAESFADFLNQVEYISRITAYDRKMLRQYEQTKETVADAGSQLEQEKSDLKELQAQVEQEQEAVQQLLAAKETELASVDEDISEANKQADAYEAEIQAQNEIIEQIRKAEEAKKAAREKAIAEAKAAAEAARKAAEAENATEEPSEADGTQNTDGTQEADATVDIPDDTYQGGAFLWPCPSSRRVTSDYGNRESPTAGASSNHKGIDIGASYGADIVAAADGTVVFAGYSSTGGNYVMIDHGGSLYTVYMHASSLNVSKGENVTQGQVIAKVGSTGISTGNHLHFGVSVDGSYVSPWNYLGR